MSKAQNIKACFIVAEVAQAHDGSLGMAHAFIDAAAKAGADAIKFQTHIAQAESTPGEPWRVKFSRQDKTRYDYWKRMEFSEAQWRALKRHAEEKNLLFLSSPFSLEAVYLLKRIGIKVWKVASGEINNLPMLEEMLATKLPMIISTGMSPLSEIDRIVKKVKRAKCPLTLMQCTSMYPCPPEKVGLSIVPFFRKRYGCKVGLSDHSGTLYAGLAAATVGIEMLEVHVTFSREMFGPDTPVSLTFKELAQLAEGIRFIEKMKTGVTDKDLIAKETAPLRKIFNKSIVLLKPLPAGTILKKSHIGFKKPGSGIPPERLKQVVGKRLKRSLKADHILRASDFA